MTNAIHQSTVIVPQAVRDAARESVGVYFESVSGCDAESSANDHLDMSKVASRIKTLERYTPVDGKRLLELGSGFGTNLASFIKDFGVDGYGVEPDGEGFGCSFASSRKVFATNGLDPERISVGVGEALPFPDESFDIVYSSFVLEHVQDPLKVLTESVRVLRSGGMLCFEMPNHLSYFEGHYLVPQPPLVFKFLPFWVRLFRRDPAFARTLRTEINPIWCRRTVKKINRTYPVTLVSLGQKEFLERLAKPFQFEMQRVAGKIGFAIRAIQRVNLGNWIGHTIVGLQGFYPILLVIRREPAKRV